MIRLVYIYALFSIMVSCKNDTHNIRAKNSDDYIFPPSKKNVYKAKLKAEGVLNCDATVIIIRNKNKSRAEKLKKGKVETILFMGDYYGGDFGFKLLGCDSLNYNGLVFSVIYYD